MKGFVAREINQAVERLNTLAHPTTRFNQARRGRLIRKLEADVRDALSLGCVTRDVEHC
jgi:hypothetical protein